MTGSAVEVTDLRKSFRVRGQRTSVVQALRGVSFSVAAGESLAIVGESGSGKTTLARIVVGLEKATAGTVALGGTTDAGLGRRERRRHRARQIQIVFQDPYSSLDPRQTGTACLDEVLRLHLGGDDAARRRRISELADQVGLSANILASLPRRMSGGQRQRLAIARALASAPAVLVLDEAVAALDVSVQAQILNLLDDIRAETSITYLFVSHDLAVVRHVTDTAVVMKDGEIVERGPTTQILDAPTHPYTQLLRASVPGVGWKPQRRSAAAAEAALA